MPSPHRLTRLLLALLALLLVQLPTAPTQAATRRLSELSATSGKVLSLLPTPDGSRVVYTAGYDRFRKDTETTETGLADLYSAPSSGGPALRLTAPITDTGEVIEFALTPDGSRVIFTYKPSSIMREQLYSVPVSGGTPALLFSPPASPPGTFGLNVIRFVMSPDSQYVIFIHSPGTSGKQIYSVPAAGGSAILLASDTQTSYGTVTIAIDVTPDNSTVLYSITPRNSLHRIPITGGTAIELSAGLIGGEQVRDFKISPDGSQVVYYTKSGAGSRTLSVPFAGGPNVQLADKAVEAQFTPDSTAVIYPYSTGSTSALVKTPIGGGTPITLTEGLSSFYDVRLDPSVSYAVSAIAGTGVYTLVSVKIADGTLTPLSTGFASLGSYYTHISPDGSRVVYLAADGSGLLSGVYSAPIAGGAAMRLDDPALTAGGVSDLRIATDSSRVVYSAKISPTAAEDLYSVPIGGGTPLKISAPLAPEEDSLFILGVGAGGQAFYTLATGVDQYNRRGTATETIYSAPIDGSAAVTVIDRSRAIYGDVISYSVSPDGGHAVYIADAEIDGLFSLYSVALPNGTPVKLSGSGMVSSPAISDNSSRVLFVENGDLYNIAIGGGTAIMLLDVAADSSISSYQIAGSQVVVLSGSFSQPGQLSRLPLAGGAATPIANNVVTFKVTDNGAQVAFNTNADPSNPNAPDQLVIAPLSGGAPVEISAYDVTSYQLSPDGSRVVYYDAGEPMFGVAGLYSTPTAGGTPTAIVSATNVTEYSISPDSQRVLYISRVYDNNSAAIDSLNSAPIGGGAVIPLVTAPPKSFQSYQVSLSYKISPDSARVVYSTASDNFATSGTVLVTTTLASKPIGGGAANTIFSSAIERIIPYAISENSASVVFLTSTSADFTTTSTTLYSAPISGTNALQLASGQNSNLISSFVLSPDSAEVAYTTLSGSLLSMALSGGPSAAIVTPTLPRTGAIDHSFLPNGLLIYRGDLLTDELFHLFIADETEATPAFTSTSLTIAENSGTLNIPVQLSSAATIPLSFNVTQVGGTAVAGLDYTLTTPTLSFAAGTTAQTITLTLLDRPGFSEPRTLTLGILPASARLAAVEPLATISITISDNDPRALYLPMVIR